MLHNRKLLKMCYTQNIDTLERLAGLPDDAIVEAHGSFANQHCIECGSWYDEHKLKDQILRGEIAYCYECGGLVKPDIVFFGESVSLGFDDSCTGKNELISFFSSYLLASTRLLVFSGLQIS